MGNACRMFMKDIAEYCVGGGTRAVLHGGVCAGRSDLILKVLEDPNFDDANSTAMYEDTALHGAAAHGHSDICSMLLESEAFTASDAKNSNDETALHLAAACGHGDVCKVLLVSSAFSQVGAVDNEGMTALHTAAAKGRGDICCLILEHKGFSAVNVKSQEGHTALHLMLHHGLPDAARMLLEEGSFSEVNARASLRNPFPDGSLKKDYTAFDLAARHGFVDVCRMLLDAGGFAGINSSMPDYPSALHLAAFEGHSAVVRLLLDARAELEARNNKGLMLRDIPMQWHLELPHIYDTPLTLAALGAHEQVVSVLVEARACPNDMTRALYAMDYPYIKKRFESIPRTTLELQRRKVAEHLLEAKADPHHKDECGNTPLIIAASYGFSSVVKLLLDARVDPGVRSLTPSDVSMSTCSRGHTALYLAPSESCTSQYYSLRPEDAAMNAETKTLLRRALADWGYSVDDQLDGESSACA